MILLFYVVKSCHIIVKSDQIWSIQRKKKGTQCLYFLLILDLVNESKEDPKNKQTKTQRIQKNKSTLEEVEKLTSEVAEAVKLPQIDTKKGRGRKPKSAKTTAAAQDTNNVTIEEFVPALVSILSYT